jgi:hypothetical protein
LLLKVSIILNGILRFLQVNNLIIKGDEIYFKHYKCDFGSVSSTVRAGFVILRVFVTHRVEILMDLQNFSTFSRVGVCASKVFRSRKSILTLDKVNEKWSF